MGGWKRNQAPSRRHQVDVTHVVTQWYEIFLHGPPYLPRLLCVPLANQVAKDIIYDFANCKEKDWRGVWKSNSLGQYLFGSFGVSDHWSIIHYQVTTL